MPTKKRRDKPVEKQPVNVGTSAHSAEDRLRLVIDAAPNAMLMADEEGHITLVNIQATKLFGYTSEELLSLKVEDLIPKGIRAEHRHYRHDFFSAPDTRSMGTGRDLYGLCKNGKKIPIEIGLNPLRTDEGLFVLASIIDISERKHAEERFRLMVEAAPNAMLIVNKEGAITLVNSQAEKLFGYSRHELLGKMIETLVPADVRAKHPRLRGNYFNAPSARYMGAGRDLFGVTKSGKKIPVEIGLNPIETVEGTLTLASIIDITERKRVEYLSRQEHTNLLRQSILDSIPFSVIAIDLKGDIIAANPAAARMLGYSRDEMVGKNAATLLHVADEINQHAARLSRELGIEVLPDHDAIIAKARLGMEDESEWTYLRKNGERIPVQLNITALHDDDGELSGYLKVAYDISDRKRTEAFILRMAHHDSLTGLPNRVLLMDRLEMAIKQARKNGELVGVLLLDLDHFKRVNDTLGHHVGDQLLIAMSNRLQRYLRDADTLARLGGDEFVIVLPEVVSQEAMQQAVDRIVSQIAQPIKVGEREMLVTPSVGGAVFPSDGNDAQTLLKNADAAMYSAKAAGRNNAQWFNEDMLRQNKEKLQLTSALKPALESDQFRLVYQPEICLKTGRIIGLETLIRWRHPTLGEIAPDKFISLAEETGLILPIGEWVLTKACSDVVRLNKEHGLNLEVAVNVSPRQLQQAGWIGQIRKALEASGMPGTSLELEITEGMLIQNPKESTDLLHEVRALGVRVVIDDFGTGYSSLSYLTRFPIDKLKIDRTFVRDLTVDTTDAAVVDAVIAMAHSLGLKVVAEGVETVEQLTYLKERNCDEAQGYYFSPAISAEEIPDAIERIAEQLNPDQAAPKS